MNINEDAWASVTAVIVIMTDSEENYADKVLSSAVSQTYPTKVLVVYNENLLWMSDLVLKYGNRIAFFKVPLMHASAARNLGTKLAETEYVAFLDGDDFWDDLKIELQMEELKKSNFKIFAGCDHRLVNPRGEKFFFGLCRHIPMPSSWIVKKDFVLKYPFDESLFRHEDADWWIKNKDFLHPVRVPKVLLSYTVRENSKSSTNATKKRKEKILKFSKFRFGTYFLLAISFLGRVFFLRKTYRQHSSWKP